MSYQKTGEEFLTTTGLVRCWTQDVSVDLIVDGLYLGNLASAKNSNNLDQLKITHILTIDILPLPSYILERTGLTYHYISLKDEPTEDLLSHLCETNEFIKQAIAIGGTVLVHCHYGASRSAAVVTAYIMERFGLNCEDALLRVKERRELVNPNNGFIEQLKLFGHMTYKLNKAGPRFKQFQLKFVREKLNHEVQMKFLSQPGLAVYPSSAEAVKNYMKMVPELFKDLVKPDPAMVLKKPDHIVLRCTKCTRIVASQENIIPHITYSVSPGSAEKNTSLKEQIHNLASELTDIGEDSPEENSCEPRRASDVGPSQVKLYRSEMNLFNMVDSNVAIKIDLPGVCRRMWFVEPMLWMRDVTIQPGGMLKCPTCHVIIGKFDWILPYTCPCGQKIVPAFSLLPTKVEWYNPN